MDEAGFQGNHLTEPDGGLDWTPGCSVSIPVLDYFILPPHTPDSSCVCLTLPLTAAGLASNLLRKQPRGHFLDPLASACTFAGPPRQPPLAGISPRATP